MSNHSFSDEELRQHIASTPGTNDSEISRDKRSLWRRMAELSKPAHLDGAPIIELLNALGRSEARVAELEDWKETAITNSDCPDGHDPIDHFSTLATRVAELESKVENLRRMCSNAESNLGMCMKRTLQYETSQPNSDGRVSWMALRLRNLAKEFERRYKPLDEEVPKTKQL